MDDPFFWEVPFEQDALEQFSNEDHMWYETGADQEDRYQREMWVSDIINEVYDILATYLTPRQCEVVILYFLHRKTQQEIGDILGISRRVVSQHLFGINRGGKQIGGAMKNLHKLCVKHGIHVKKT